MNQLKTTLLIAFLSAGLPACSATSAPPAATQSSPQSSPGKTFSSTGIQLSYPAGWTPQDSKDYVLYLHPSSDSEVKSIWLSLDIPELPIHIPGMIPIGSVRNGYLDDLKKQVGRLDTKDLPAPKIPDAKIRFLRSTWHAKDGAETQETALLLVHADHVYILRAHSDTAHESSIRPAFDSIVQSLKWTHK